APAKGAAPGFGLASSDDQYNPKVLPRRLMGDEPAGRFYKLASPEFAAAFEKAAAHWLSCDCHRSQYGYPFRVAIELALENRHRSVTLASFTCSGSAVTEGLVLDMDPRAGASAIPAGKVRAHPAPLSELICRGARAACDLHAARLPARQHAGLDAERGQGLVPAAVAQARDRPRAAVDRRQRRRLRRARRLFLDREHHRPCPDRRPRGLGRPFEPVLAAGLTHLSRCPGRAHAGAQAGVAGWFRCFSRARRAVVLRADPPRRDRRAVRDAAGPGHGRASRPQAQPAAPAGDRGFPAGAARPAGMHRRQESRAGRRGGAAAPAGLATGAGTGFRLVTEHIREFARRGLCARDPKRALADGIAMRMPRKPGNGSAFKPYSPAATLPYAHHWRLFRTPNDAFLAANTHREGSPLFDILQPAYAGLYSGAIHPTAEAHAIVADHVVRHVRKIVDKPEAKHEMVE